MSARPSVGHTISPTRSFGSIRTAALQPVPRRGSPLGGQVIADSAGWVGARCRWQRSAEKVDAPACIRGGSPGIGRTSKAEVSRSAPLVSFV
jgi:hypothetical protein